MRLDEFRRINLKVTKNHITLYEGSAEDLPEELKGMECLQIQLESGLAEVEV